MKAEPILSRITIYPVKSLDGMVLQQAMITEGGCLLHDREFAMSDEKGNFINGKSNARVHTLRSSVDFENDTISFKDHTEKTWNHFHLQHERTALESFLSDYFSMPVILLQNKTGRFLDSPDRGGVTVLSTSSLQSVSEWFPGLSLEETRSRFRATLEIEGSEAFWEDNLFSKPGTNIKFRIGDVTVYGTSPCARCAVPSRNPVSGETIQSFQKSFTTERSAKLPAWSELNEYGHFYYMSVNCYIPPTEIGKWVKIGDQVNIIGDKEIY